MRLKCFIGRKKNHKISPCDLLSPLSTKVFSQDHIKDRSHLTCDLYSWVTSKREFVFRMGLCFSFSPSGWASLSNSALFLCNWPFKGASGHFRCTTTGLEHSSQYHCVSSISVLLDRRPFGTVHLRATQYLSLYKAYRRFV